MGRIEGVVDDGAARCAVGGWYSPSVRRVHLELRGGLFSLLDNHRRMTVRTHTSTQLTSFSAARSLLVSHAWSVYNSMMGSGGFHVVAGYAVDGLWCHLFFVARACSNSATSDPRLVRVLSRTSSTRYTHRITTIGCVVRVEAREEERAAGRGREKPWGGWIESDRSLSCFFGFFRSRVHTAPDRR